jgi:hypothetical protein
MFKKEYSEKYLLKVDFIINIKANLTTRRNNINKKYGNIIII